MVTGVWATSEGLQFYTSQLAHTPFQTSVLPQADLYWSLQEQPDLLVKRLLRDLLDIHQIELGAMLQQAHRLSDHAYKGVVPEELAGLCSMDSAA